MRDDAQTERQPEDPSEVAPDEEAEPELDPVLAARRTAAMAQIRSFGDPVLRTRARPVERFDDALRTQVRRMAELMNDALGVGLAAPQVGVVNRVLVYRIQHQAPVAALILVPQIAGRPDLTLALAPLALIYGVGVYAGGTALAASQYYPRLTKILEVVTRE